jgi:cyclophilin family peptidyl-prolyl cis-trans isomerase
MPTPLLGQQLSFLLPWVCAAAALAQSQPPDPTTSIAPDQAAVHAELLPERSVVQAGQAVWVRLMLTNLSANPVTLKAPDTILATRASSDDQDPPQVGLPLTHVFSGFNFSAITITDERNQAWDIQVGVVPRGAVPAIRLAPQASVGLRMDLTQHYPSLRHPGKYTLTWRPYNGTLASAPLTSNVLAERQAVITTELGTMTMRFYFDEAPLTVQNFIELVEKGFYDRLTFHKIIPHALIQGGDPTGSGTGARPDGKRVKAEFSNIPFKAGTVGMARLKSDPDSASCQFFITASRQAALDGDQTAFGYLVDQDSMRTLERIAAVGTDDKGRPLQPVAIRRIKLENVPNRPSQGTGGDLRTPTTRPAIMSDGHRGSSSHDSSERPASRPAPGPAD